MRRVAVPLLYGLSCCDERMRTTNIHCTAKTLELLHFIKTETINREAKTAVLIQLDVAKNHGFSANFNNRNNTIFKTKKAQPFAL